MSTLFNQKSHCKNDSDGAVFSIPFSTSTGRVGRFEFV